jgi:cellulose 1,4-beta-cellobiosidase
MKTMGEALARGMVLAMSIWDDGGSYILWLDSTPEVGEGNPEGGGWPCTQSSERPEVLIKEYLGMKVVFSDIRSGEIGSTFGNATTATV